MQATEEPACLLDLQADLGTSGLSVDKIDPLTFFFFDPWPGPEPGSQYLQQLLEAMQQSPAKDVKVRHGAHA